MINEIAGILILVILAYERGFKNGATSLNRDYEARKPGTTAKTPGVGATPKSERPGAE